MNKQQEKLVHRVIANQDKILGRLEKITTHLEETILPLSHRVETNGTSILSLQSASFKLIERMISVHDPYVKGHGEGVAELAARLAPLCGVDESEMQNLRYAALIHDVGKIGLTEAVIFKPGILSGAERVMINQHPSIGFNLLDSLGLPESVCQAILHHHENQDGTGYPDGQSGESITLFARIIHVADVHDALTHDRPYRSARTPEQAIKIMQDEAQLYDPLALKSLVEIVRNIGIERK